MDSGRVRVPDFTQVEIKQFLLDESLISLVIDNSGMNLCWSIFSL